MYLGFFSIIIFPFCLIYFVLWIYQVITTSILICHENWLVNLYLKRIWQIIYTYWGFIHYNFVCFFIIATRMHPSSNLRNGCRLPSEIWDGKYCCFCFVNTSASWSCSGSSCGSCSLPHKRTGLSGISSLVYLNYFYREICLLILLCVSNN